MSKGNVDTFLTGLFAREGGKKIGIVNPYGYIGEYQSNVGIRPLVGPLIVILCILSFFPRAALSATFEEMLSGFDQCQFKDVYIDLITKKPVHLYFLERELQPCEIKEGMAYFCLTERYYGLPVYKLMVPSGTFDIHAMYIALPINESRNMIRKKFGTEYRESGLSDIGEKPVLLANPNDPNKSILMCDPRSE